VSIQSEVEKNQVAVQCYLCLGALVRAFQLKVFYTITFGSFVFRAKHLPFTGFVEHPRSDSENIINFISMNRWLKSGSLK
jgi:hypothetical protein